MFEHTWPGWNRVNLIDLATYINGYAFKPEDWSEHGLPIVRIAQITGSSADCDYYQGRLSEDFKIDSGDIVFSWSGTLCVVQWNGGSAWLNQHLFKVKPAEGVSQRLLYHVLSHAIAEMDKSAHGSTLKHIKRSELKRYELLFPKSRKEQEKIGRVLDTLDTQIQKTEALIAKLEKVKEGLLHDLLTRGIDENGRLRPSPEQAPELYKESPLGLIPREWSVGTLGQRLSEYGGFIQTGPFGSQLHAEEYVIEGIPVVMPQDMRDIEVSKENVAQITEERASDLLRHRVIHGDLLFSRRGDLSRCSYISEANKGWLCGTGCLLLRPAQNMNGYWLAHVYKQPRIQAQVYGMAVGSTMVNLNSGILANITTPFPSLQEQDQVAKTIKSYKRKVFEEKYLLSKLKLQKSGLMDDLLTGRVRVTPLLERAQATTPA